MLAPNPNPTHLNQEVALMTRGWVLMRNLDRIQQAFGSIVGYTDLGFGKTLERTIFPILGPKMKGLR